MENITWKTIFLAIAIFCAGMYIDEIMSTSNIPDAIIIKEIEIDTLKITKDKIKYKYLESLKQVTKWDTLYVSGKDTICDSLVEAQKLALKNCDTLQVVQEKIIYKLDTVVNLQKIYIRETKGRKPRLGPFIGVGLNPDGSIRPSLGGGLVF